MLSSNNNSTRYAANLQTPQTPDSVITQLYPLAQQIKTIITDQLASATDNLPAGLRFDPDGTIFTAANRVFGNWSLQKENIVVSPSEGDRFHIPAAQLAAAMTPGANPNE